MYKKSSSFVYKIVNNSSGCTTGKLCQSVPVGVPLKIGMLYHVNNTFQNSVF